MTESVRPIEISIVIPCLNEAETVGVCVKKAQESMLRHGLDVEIIVADNGSTDGSRHIAEEAGARVVPVAERGYGAALAGGVRAARGAYIIMGDADESYDFSEIFPFVKKLREGYDLVMGCRLGSCGGRIMPGAMPWKNRWIGNPALSAIGRIFFRVPITDFHCGLRGFRRDAFERMNLHTTGMEFASEMVVKAALLGMSITEIPIILHRAGRPGAPHLRPWRDGWRHLRFMLMYSPRWLFFLPGTLLFLAGMAFFIVLSMGPLSLGPVTFDTNTLIVSAMSMNLGFQLVALYFFARVFAVSEGLLPEDPQFRRLVASFSLEAGLLAGLAVALAGFGFLVVALLAWVRQGFGPLSYPESLRIVVPATTMIILGVQVIVSAFFLSILGLPRR